MSDLPTCITHITTSHNWDDVRIYQKMCRSLAADGHNVHLVATRGFSNESESVAAESGVTLHRTRHFACRSLRFLLGPLFVMMTALRTRAELYHLHDPELIPAGLILRLLGRRVVYDAHEDLPSQLLSKPYLPGFVRKPFARLVSLFLRFALPWMSGLVAAVPAIDRVLHNGCKAVVNNYPLAQRFATNRPTVNRLPNQLIYVGSVTETRGILELLDALTLLPESVRLLVIGQIASEALADRIERHPVAHRVDCLGFQPAEVVWRHLDQSAIGLVTLHPIPNYCDSRPVKLFEYLGAELPAVASDFAEWRHLTDQFECVRFVDPLDPEDIAAALSELLAKPKMSREMGRRGREAVLSNYLWEAEFSKLREFYADILGATRPGTNATEPAEPGVSSNASTVRKVA